VTRFHRFINRPWGRIRSMGAAPSYRWRVYRVQWWFFAAYWVSRSPDRKKELHDTWADAMGHENEQLKGTP
jgi:hypothetical protein